MSSMDLTIYDFSTLLRKRIASFRSSLLDKQRIIDCYGEVKTLLKKVSSFEDEINQRANLLSSDELKEQLYSCLGYDYEFLKKFKEGLNYILKFDRRSAYFQYENHLLKAICRKYDVEIEIHDLQVKAIETDDKVCLEDGVTVVKGDVKKYQNLSSSLKETKKKEQDMIDKIERENSPVKTVFNREEMEVVSFVGSVKRKADTSEYTEADYLEDQRDVEEIKKARGRKTTIKVNGKKYWIAKSEASKFRSAMIRMQKYESQLKPFHSNKVNQNICMIGTGRMESGCVVSRHIDGNVLGIGRIYVDGEQDPHSDKIQQRVGMATKTEFDYFSGVFVEETHHNFFGIKRRKTPRSLMEMKKKIATAAVAVALSIVTAVTSLGFSNILKKDEDMVNIYDSSSVSSISENSNVSTDITNMDKKATISKNDNQVSSINSDSKKDDLTDHSVFQDETIIFNQETNKEGKSSSEKFTIETSEEKIVSLGDKITIKEGSPIYVSSDNADQQVYGLKPAFSYNQERDVDMIVFNNNGVLVYADEKSEYDYCLKREYDISCVRTGDGYFNGNDIIIVDDEEGQKVKVRVS